MLNKKLLINESVTHVVKLPFPGELMVEYGEKVESKTLIARTELIHGIPAYLNILSMLEIKIGRFAESLSCTKGEFVKANTILASYGKKLVTAPFRGWVEYISYSNGYILFRQLVKKNEKPTVVQAAKLLGISPNTLKNVILVKEGKNVLRKQGLAGDIEYITSPISGFIEKIEYKEGTITIKPHYRPTELYSRIQGRITKAYPQYGAEITTNADVLYGVFGAGTKVTGHLAFNLDEVDSSKPSILVIERQASAAKLKDLVIAKQLRKWDKKNIIGIIAGSMDAQDLVELYGDSVYEGITGMEDFPFSIIIIEGFGDQVIRPELLNHLKDYNHSLITIYPESNCHPPVKLPKVYIYKQEG